MIQNYSVVVMMFVDAIIILDTVIVMFLQIVPATLILAAVILKLGAESIDVVVTQKSVLVIVTIVIVTLKDAPAILYAHETTIHVHLIQ